MSADTDAAEVERNNPARWPGLILLIIGVTDVLISLTFMVGGDAIFELLIEAAKEQNPDFDPSSLGDFGSQNMLLTILGLVIGLLVVAGGWSMMQVKSWGLALTGAILSMIPCLGTCCGLSLPFGVWALIVLMKPEVKQAFRQSSG